MKLLKIISVGVLAGYCYKKLKAKKKPKILNVITCQRLISNS